MQTINSAEMTRKPAETFRRLREDGPIHRTDDGAWAVISYRDVCAIFEDSRFISDVGNPILSLFSKNQNKFPALRKFYLNWFVLQDGKKHTDYRSMIRPAFYRGINNIYPSVKDVVDQLFSDMKEKREFDFKTAFALPFPIYVTGEIFGVPKEDRPRLLKWANDVAMFAVGESGSNVLKTLIDAETSLGEMTAYFRQQVEERKQNPCEDFVSLLLPHFDGNDDELADIVLAQFSMLYFGGYTTISRHLAVSLCTLLNHPEKLQPFRSGTKFDHKTIREMLRYDSPLQIIPRIANEDVVLHDQLISKGDRVFLLLGAANRDPARYREPDTFDPDRDEGTNLAMGMGPHICIGASLAIVESKIAFTSIFSEFPNIEVIEKELRWEKNPTMRGVETLHVRV
jgi:pimeloyl-[acyl-carrier protein] synthase